MEGAKGTRESEELAEWKEGREEENNMTETTTQDCSDTTCDGGLQSEGTYRSEKQEQEKEEIE